MAEAGGIVQLVLASAASAAELSLALFNVAQTLNNAPKEVPEIAEELSMFAGGLQTLADVIEDNQDLCKPALFQSTHTILGRYDQVEAEIKLLIETPEGLDTLRWYIKEPQVKSLLKKVEGIKSVLILESNIIRLAKEESSHPHPILDTGSVVTTSSSTSNRYRVVVESAVQANRQVVQSAQRDNAKLDAWQQRNFAQELKVWKPDSFDTATWLYHLVFSIGSSESATQRPPPFDFEASACPVAPDSKQCSYERPPICVQSSAVSADKAAIQWGRDTEPSLVVDRLLHAWTTLSSERIVSSSRRDDYSNWRVQHLKMIQDLRKEEAREEVPAASSSTAASKQVPKIATCEDYFSSEEDRFVELPKPEGRQGKNNKVPNLGVESSDYTDDWDEWDKRAEIRPKNKGAQLPQGPVPPNSGTQRRTKQKEGKKPMFTLRTKTESQGPSYGSSNTAYSFSETLRKMDKNKTPSRRPYSYNPFSETQWPPWAPPVAIPPFPDYDYGASIPPHGQVPAPSFAPHPGGPPMPSHIPSEYARPPNPSKAMPSVLPHPPAATFSRPPYNPSEYTRPNPPTAPTSMLQHHGVAPNLMAPYPPIAPTSMPPYHPSENPWSIPAVARTPVPAPASVNTPAQHNETSQDRDTSTLKNAKEASMITMLENLLKKHENDSKDADDGRLSRIVQLLEQRLETEKRDAEESSRSTMEAQFTDIQAAREEQENKLKELQNFISQQEKAQQRAEAKWIAERASLNEKAARESKETGEAREQAAREIAEAKSAKKAARKSLKIAKTEAEKQANSEVDIKVAAELTRIEHEHRKQMELFQEQLRAIQAQQPVPEPTAPRPDSPRPIRRTRMSDKNRSVDVLEYATNNIGRSMLQPFSPFKFVQEELFSNETDSERRIGRSQSQHSRHDSFLSSTRSVASESTSNVSAVSRPQQLVVLPSKIDRNSAEILEMQSSLAHSGVDSIFDDIESDNGKQLVKYEDTNEQVVRSTVFWEPPVLTLGSELLLTLRKSGWQPIYTRTSDAGQTHYLGNQPIHSYFFRPDYQPQFSPPSKASPTNTIIIQKALVEEYALQELGFEFETTNMGTYILDGRLTYNDIEALIERSFLMRENNFRRQHRQLQQHYTRAPAASKAEYEEDYAESTIASGSSVSVAQSCSTCADHDRDSDSDHRSSPIDSSSFNVRKREQFLVPETGHPEHESDLGDSSGDETISVTRSTRVSPVPPSTASKSSVSTNPYHRYMQSARESERGGSSQRVTRTVLDELEGMQDKGNISRSINR